MSDAVAGPLSTQLDFRNVVGGAPVDGEGSIAVVNPWTGEDLGAVACADAAVVGEAVEASARAFAAWRWTTPVERFDALMALASSVEARLDEMAWVESLDSGKPLEVARGEVVVAIDTLRFFAGAARTLDGGGGANEYSPGSTSVLRREPLGTVGLITPWNYPLLEAVWKVGPALAAGNGCVLKPSELTPLTALFLARLACDVLPAGLFNVVTGTGPATGEALVRHPGISMVSFTGSAASGRAVAGAAAEHLARVHLELGGNAPVIVLEDAPLEATAEGVALAAFDNSGQSCTAAARVIVAAPAYDELVERLVAKANELALAQDPEDPHGGLGPLVSERQRDRALGFVERADAAGGRVLAGGGAPDRPGFFMDPTVVVDVAQDSEIVQGEVFGPVVTVQRVDSFDEAIACANDVPQGLAASIWTDSVRHSTLATRELEFGTVWVNNHSCSPIEAPFAGFRQSGYGTEMSAESLHEYSRTKHVMTTVVK
jgi:betaine-aldehyde dehydrogenase/aminobutyraldehyde dehydrogenase